MYTYFSLRRDDFYFDNTTFFFSQHNSRGTFTNKTPTVLTKFVTDFDKNFKFLTTNPTEQIITLNDNNQSNMSI